ncbi:hypothetical protein J6590_057368 [Homalodisca vitripennis]|nr:hypothetical protein J6590_057368 [Homalodisca vitripennis]
MKIPKIPRASEKGNAVSGAEPIPLHPLGRNQIQSKELLSRLTIVYCKRHYSGWSFILRETSVLFPDSQTRSLRSEIAADVNSSRASG